MTEIPLFPGSTEVVKIDAETISFDDWTLRIKDVTALSFMMSYYGGIISSEGGRVVLHTSTTKKTIAIKDYTILGFCKGEINIAQIWAAIADAVGGGLLIKICTLVFVENIPVKIGSVTFTAVGIECFSITGKKFIPWAYKPHIGYATKTPIFDNRTISGNIAIQYTDPGNGKRKEFAKVTSDEPNGFLVPYILDFARENIV